MHAKHPPPPKLPGPPQAPPGEAEALDRLRNELGALEAQESEAARLQARMNAKVRPVGSVRRWWWPNGAPATAGAAWLRGMHGCPSLQCQHSL